MEQKVEKEKAPAGTEAYQKLINKLIEKGDSLSQKTLTASEYKELVEAVIMLQPFVRI